MPTPTSNYHARQHDNVHIPRNPSPPSLRHITPRPSKRVIYKVLIATVIILVLFALLLLHARTTTRTSRLFYASVCNDIPSIAFITTNWVEFHEPPYTANIDTSIPTGSLGVGGVLILKNQGSGGIVTLLDIEPQSFALFSDLHYCDSPPCQSRSSQECMVKVTSNGSCDVLQCKPLPITSHPNATY